MTKEKKMIIISTCTIMAGLISISANAIYCSYFPKWEGQTNDKNWSASIKYYPFDKVKLQSVGVFFHPPLIVS